MSSRNEGEQPEYAADPSSQFDAFRARQADDRAQQETQGAYVFPPEYAADPAALFPDEAGGPGRVPGREPSAGFGARWARAGSEAGRLRSVGILAGAAVLAVGIGFGVYEAFGSAGPSAGAGAGAASTATAAPAVPAATGSGAAATRVGRVVEVRVVIEAIGADSFTGHLLATGQQVTVRIDGDTRFGTTAHPFRQGQLTVGETVLVRARRTAADVLTATLVVGA